MVWVIGEFSDLTVSAASEKWLRDNGRKCFYPKKNVASKIKNEADVDTKSEKWSLLPFRILMKGQRFATYAEAREAEKIAQNHSTMSSFQNSYLAKQKARKHPMVFKSSSSSEDEAQDFKNIKKLAKLDARLTMNQCKKYNYDRNDNDNHSPPLKKSSSRSTPDKDNRSVGSDSSRSPSESDNRSVGSGSSRSPSESDNRSAGSGSSRSSRENSNQSVKSGSSRSSRGSDNRSVKSDSSNSVYDDSWSVDGDSINEDFNENSSDVRNENPRDQEIFSDHNNILSSNKVDESQPFVNEGNFVVNMENNLESTEQLPSPGTTYDFNEDRRLIRLEKLLMHACQELQSIKADVKEIKLKANQTESEVQNLALVCKDLSIEVFACTEEIKKRNGMFTDMLVPDIKVPIKRTKQFDKVELALKRHKIVDNLIKYLASTVNETKEKPFIRKCFSVIFGLKFFCLKVWWKKMPGKVLIKNSQILHCMRESFKIKFGLVEPKKSDKDINDLIYKVGRNVKDSWRKLWKNEDVANKNADDWNAMERKKCRRKGDTSKHQKHDSELDEREQEEDGRTAEEDKKVKKAAKKVRKTKEAADAKHDNNPLEAQQAARAVDEDIQASEEDNRVKKAAKKARKAKEAPDAEQDNDPWKAQQVARAVDEDIRAKEEEDKRVKKATKKARKAKEAANAARNDGTLNIDEAGRRTTEEDKEAKKAAKKARKAKEAADAARDDDTYAATRVAMEAAEEEAQQKKYIQKRKKRTTDRGDESESKGKVKKYEKE